jgi:hypothetical protein
LHYPSKPQTAKHAYLTAPPAPPPCKMDKKQLEKKNKPTSGHIELKLLQRSQNIRLLKSGNSNCIPRLHAMNF